MATVGELIVKLSANISDFEKNMSEVDKSLQDVGKRFSDVGAGMTKFLTLPIFAAGAASLKLASDMNETLNKVSVAFGSSADQVKQWSENSIQSMGLAGQTALDSAALFGDMATGMGISRDAAASMSMGLTQLGADLASFKNVPVKQAMTALSGVFTGETESLKGLGIVMTQTNLQAFAMSKGITKNVQDMTQAEQVNLRYAFILDKTKNAQGDFARTSDGAANQTRMFTENLKQLGANFGAVILPAFTKVINGLNAMLVQFQSLSPGVQKVILIFAGLVASIGPVLFTVGKFMTILPILKAGLTGLIPAIANLGKAFMFLATNPIGLIITAVAAAVAIGIYMYKNWDTVRINLLKIVNAIGYGFQQGFSYLKTVIFTYIEIYLSAFSKLLGWIPGIGDKIKAAKGKMSDLIDSEKVKRDMNSVNFSLKQNSLNVQLNAIKTAEADKIKKDATKTNQSATIAQVDLTKAINNDTAAKDKNTKSTKSAADAAAELRDKNVKALDSLGSALVTALRSKYEKAQSIQVSALEKEIANTKKATEEKIKLYDKELASKLKLLDAETLSSVNALQKQISDLENKTKAEEKLIQQQKRADEYAQKEKELLAADTEQERLKIQKEISDMRTEDERSALLDQRQLQIDALNKQIQEIKANAEEKKNVLEEEYAAKKQQAEDELDIQTSKLETELANVKAHFSTLLSEESLNAEARKMVVGKNQDEIIALLGEYNKDWQNAGQSFGESLIDGLLSTKQTMKQAIDGMLSLVKGTTSTVQQKVASTFSSADTVGYKAGFVTVPGTGGLQIPIPKIDTSNPSLGVVNKVSSYDIPMGQMSGTGGTTNVTVNMPIGSNGDDVVRALKNYERMNGYVPITVG